MLIKKINEILYEWDPIDLKDCYVPLDEYMPEALQIYNYILTNPKPDELAKVIYKVFLYYFGEDCFNRSIEECLDISLKCLSLKLSDK